MVLDETACGSGAEHRTSEAGTQNGQKQTEGKTGRFHECHHERCGNELQETDPLAGGFFCLHSGCAYLWFCTKESTLTDQLDFLF